MKPFKEYWAFFDPESHHLGTIRAALKEKKVRFEFWTNGTSVIVLVNRVDAEKHLQAVRAKPNSGDGPWNRLLPPNGWRLVPNRLDPRELGGRAAWRKLE